MHAISLKLKILATVLVVGGLGAVGLVSTFSSFSATTSNASNRFQGGSVVIGDDDAGSAMYSLTDQAPGASISKCIKVTYTGSLDSSVKLYASGIGAGGQYIDLTVTPGTGGTTFPACAGFTAAAGGAIYTGTLKNFGDSYTNFASGLASNPEGATKWVTNDAVVYRFTLTLQSANSANNADSGTHTFTWEAQNQ